MARNPLREMQDAERCRSGRDEAFADHVHPRSGKSAALPQMRDSGAAARSDSATTRDAAASFPNRSLNNVLVWTASHPHGLMALSASQKDERKV
jgi:phytoene/squalene synthetase